MENGQYGNDRRSEAVIMISLSNISFQYPQSDFRLQLGKLDFSQGSKTAVVGPSGFGKTTLLHLISGIYVPQAGDVMVHGKKVHLMSDAGRRTFRLKNIGFVFQDFKLLEYLNVMDNILLPYRINKAMKLEKVLKNHVFEIASMLSIEDKLARNPGRLSQGERQRVAICRALLTNPSIILADEPTGNLDPENKRNIMRILFDYVSKIGATLVVVTHDHELLSGFDHVVDFKGINTSE